MHQLSRARCARTIRICVAKSQAEQEVPARAAERVATRGCAWFVEDIGVIAEHHETWGAR
jgi:hypothetical protein